ncbi:MAG TPA: thioredoxin family protein [Bacteroidota bacterium]
MKTCFLIVVAFLCFLISTVAKPLETRNTPAGSPGQDSVASAAKTREKFDPSRDASQDIANAILLAQKEGKRILLDVGGEWCSWCHKLDKFFLDNKDVADFLSQHFVVVKVNYSKENKNEKVLSVYPPINGYPHLFVLENDGKLLHSQDTGELESGNHHDHDKVFNFLKKWAPQSKM